VNRIRIGVSACLLGERVRFDGQHKRNAFLVDELGPVIEWVRVCPEIEVGMGVPREAVRLVAHPNGPRMVALKSGADWTARMNRLAYARARALADEDLSGFVLKSKSPSCGMERVKIYPDAETAGPSKAPMSARGSGLFAAALARRLPNLPMEEEGRLEDARLRDGFIERVFAYNALQELWRTRWTLGGLVAFHTAHKMTLLAHTPEGYRELGRLVATGKSLPRATLRARYEAAFMAALAKPTSSGRHANVLTHLLGHLKDQLDDDDKRELLDLIEAHRLGRLPLVVPLTLLAHHARRLRATYLLGQTYLSPGPEELRLRNHA
jgi:uncharacterized protein YbgA (DUF1722 family)/uncharacterized protein YbbK (DUF523 family)